MRNRALVCISLILAGSALLAQPSSAASHANRALRNLLAATGHAPLGTLQTYQPDPASPNEWNGRPTGLAFLDRALRSLDLSEGANYFMQGSRANGGMAVSVNRAAYPGHGYMLDLRWQLGQ